MVPVKMKCSVCGATVLYKIDTFSNERSRYGLVAGKYTNKRGVFNYRYSTSGKVGLQMEISTSIDSYVCKCCGHIEFYGRELLNKIETDESYYNDKVKVLKAELEVAKENKIRFMNDYEIAKRDYANFRMENDYSMDSTERIQFENKKSDFNDKLKAIKLEIDYEEYKINDIEKLIKEYEFFLENVFNIVLR